MTTQPYFETTDISTANKDFKRGDVVKMYKESTQIEYPCLVLSCETLEMYRVKVIEGLLGCHVSPPEGTTLYHTYIHMQDQLIKVGVLPAPRLRYILTSKVFDHFGKQVHPDPQTTITGEMLFALCVV